MSQQFVFTNIADQICLVNHAVEKNTRFPTKKKSHQLKIVTNKLLHCAHSDTH